MFSFANLMAAFGTSKATPIVGTWNFDKLIHFLGCAFFIVMAAHLGYAMWLGFAVSVVFAVARECQKIGTPGENAEWISIGCDAAGMLAGYGWAVYMLK